MRTINESFTCITCNQHVSPAAKTCRNHCPYCFTSRHVDGPIPGDRNTTCSGIMYPFEYELRNGNIRIHFVCTTCSKKHRNKSLPDDHLTTLDKYIFQYKKHTL